MKAFLDNRARILHIESQIKGIIVGIKKSLEGVFALPVTQAKNRIGRLHTTLTALNFQSMSKLHNINSKKKSIRRLENVL